MKHCSRNYYEDWLIEAIFRNEIVRMADPEGFLRRRARNGRDCKQRMKILLMIPVLASIFGCAAKKPVQSKPSPPMVIVVN